MGLCQLRQAGLGMGGEGGWWALTSHFTHLTSSLWSSEHQCNNQQDHRCQFCARPCKLSPKFSHRPKLDSRDFARERKIAKSIEKSFAGLLHGGAAAAQWELPPFSGLVKRVTPDFYSTSWTFLNPSSTSSSTTKPSFTTTSPFLRLVKCTTLSLLLSQLGTPRSSTFPFQQTFNRSKMLIRHFPVCKYQKFDQIGNVLGTAFV